MRIVYYIVFVLVVLTTGCEKKKRYEPASCFSPKGQGNILKTVVRYTSKLPPRATHETKFNSEFDWYYDLAVGEAKILYCSYAEADSVYSLLVARKARSRTPMQEGIAIRLKLNQDSTFREYDEVFRMWKMPADSLERKGRFLFKTMLEGGDLKLYYTKFRKDQFIEFPDDRFTFDKEARRWRDSAMDTVRYQ